MRIHFLSIFTLFVCASSLAAEPLRVKQFLGFSSVAWSPDGKQLAVTEEDKDVVHLYSLSPLKLIKKIEFPKKPPQLQSVEFFPDGEHLLITGTDAEGKEEGLAVVKNLKTDAVVWKKEGKAIALKGAISPDGIHVALTGFDFRYVLVCDTASKEPDRKFEEPREGYFIQCTAYTRDGRGLAAVESDGVIAWSVATGKPVLQAEERGLSISQSVAFGTSNGQIFTAGPGDTVTLWDFKSSKAIWQNKHDDGVYTVAVSPDGKLVATGCHDHSVRILDAATGELKQKFERPELDGSRVVQVAWHPGGHLLAGVGGEGLAIYQIHPAPVSPISPVKKSPFKSSVDAGAPSPTPSPVPADDTAVEKELAKLNVKCTHIAFDPKEDILTVDFDPVKSKPGDLKKAIMHLKKLKSLRDVHLVSGMKDEDLALLAELKDLEKLEDIAAIDSQATNAGLLKLKPLKQLKVLNLIGAKKVTADGARALLKEMPNLEKVFLKADTGIGR